MAKVWRVPLADDSDAECLLSSGRPTSNSGSVQRPFMTCCGIVRDYNSAEKVRVYCPPASDGLVTSGMQVCLSLPYIFMGGD